jgi:hypothetical protein
VKVFVNKRQYFEHHNVMNTIHQVHFSSEERDVDTAAYTQPDISKTVSLEGSLLPQPT